jgi:hypothetical protein
LGGGGLGGVLWVWRVKLAQVGGRFGSGEATMCAQFFACAGLMRP